jgi:hypothetical protein
MNYCNRTTEDEERMKLRRKKWRKAIIMIAVVLLLCLLGYFIFDGPDRLKEAETRVVLEMVSVAVTAYSQCYQSFPVTAADFANNPRRIAFFDWGEFNPWSDAFLGGPITYTVTGAAGAPYPPFIHPTSKSRSIEVKVDPETHPRHFRFA